MKRPCEDSSSAESDAEETIDVGRESISPGYMKTSYMGCGSPTTTTQVMARKKRRGIIEKRRRDRINNSLSELRRLVPTAFEKQGSAKLEKAEILQMTVDHLKVLQATGGKEMLFGLARPSSAALWRKVWQSYFDAHALALDFLSLGFRECVTEVSRYLSAAEGLDSSDPLRSRLLSHLGSCSLQRDALAISSYSPHHHPHHHHLHQQPHPLTHPFHPHHWAAAVATAAAFRPPAYGLSGLCVSPDSAGGGAPQRLTEASRRSVASTHADSTTSSSSSAHTPLSASLLSASFPMALHGGFPMLHPASFHSSSTAATTSPPISSSPSSSAQTPHSSSKPYRPWGTEVGAF